MLNRRRLILYWLYEVVLVGIRDFERSLLVSKNTIMLDTGQDVLDVTLGRHPDGSVARKNGIDIVFPSVRFGLNLGDLHFIHILPDYDYQKYIKGSAEIHLQSSPRRLELRYA